MSKRRRSYGPSDSNVNFDSVEETAEPDAAPWVPTGPSDSAVDAFGRADDDAADDTGGRPAAADEAEEEETILDPQSAAIRPAADAESNSTDDNVTVRIEIPDRPADDIVVDLNETPENDTTSTDSNETEAADQFVFDGPAEDVRSPLDPVEPDAGELDDDKTIEVVLDDEADPARKGDDDEDASLSAVGAPTVTPPVVPPSSDEPSEAATSSPATAPAPVVAGANSSTTTEPPASRPAAAAPSSAGFSLGAFLKDEQYSQLRKVLLISYASAVTLAWLYLYMSRTTGTPHQLESLPDVAPIQEGALHLVPETAQLPPGHTLSLAESQQFGHILVEPLKVTKGPIRFEHYSGQSDAPRPPTEPTLNLWLRLTNTSDDQTIAPLDAWLLLTRLRDRDLKLRANNFVSSATTGERALIYDHPATSEWNLTGQQLGHRLAPGESFETYIAVDSDELDVLKGDLRWRIHLRKGYNADSGHGVTTLVDVVFNESDVRSES